MIALDLCTCLRINVKPALALEAITKDSDNTDNAQGQAINFQRGMGNNYERLEFIGDCFLKMVTSMAVFMDNTIQDEGEMHVIRMLMLCNSNLFKTARDAGYPKYIRGLAFSRSVGTFGKGLTVTDSCSGALGTQKASDSLKGKARRRKPKKNLQQNRKTIKRKAKRTKLRGQA